MTMIASSSTVLRVEAAAIGLAIAFGQVVLEVVHASTASLVVELIRRAGAWWPAPSLLKRARTHARMYVHTCTPEALPARSGPSLANGVCWPV